MLKGLYTAYTGMINEQHRMDTMTNNLANATTNGFKKEGATSQAFDRVLAYKLKDTSETPNLPNRIGTMSLGVKVGENYVDYSGGPFKETGNSLDLALSENGFFTIEFTNKAGETSTKYTRDGNFTMTARGELVTQDGDFVLANGGRHIRLDPNQPVTINRMGEIYQNDAYVSTIGITDFADYNYLERYGENYFQPVDGARIVPAAAEVYSGYLEMSNMSVVTEMVNMITIQRQYEANQKVITTYDSTLEDAVNQTGRV
ncbi:MAG: flagellar hook-basal body protein [Butyrivibrio sp.]|nr:flagellar hook-basal body protein [Butyrivibrio sp.]